MEGRPFGSGGGRSGQTVYQSSIRQGNEVEKRGRETGDKRKEEGEATSMQRLSDVVRMLEMCTTTLLGLPSLVNLGSKPLL